MKNKNQKCRLLYVYYYKRKGVYSIANSWEFKSRHSASQASRNPYYIYSRIVPLEITVDKHNDFTDKNKAIEFLKNY
jgi:hypothetical protein